MMSTLYEKAAEKYHQILGVIFFDNFRCSIWLPPLWLYPPLPTEHSYEGREERSTWGVSSSVPVLSATRLQHDCVEK